MPGAPRGAAPHEDRVPVGSANLYARDIGRGQPIVVLHGGPDFDHSYLLPDMDRLSDSFRLIYYDQRGRGKSGDGVRAEDVPNPAGGDAGGGSSESWKYVEFAQVPLTRT